MVTVLQLIYEYCSIEKNQQFKAKFMTLGLDSFPR